MQTWGENLGINGITRERGMICKGSRKGPLGGVVMSLQVGKGRVMKGGSKCSFHQGRNKRKMCYCSSEKRQFFLRDSLQKLINTTRLSWGRSHQIRLRMERVF